MIVTSGASAGVFLERHVANLRLGMTLELFTAIGALLGGLVAFLLPEQALEILFAGLLVYTSITMLRRGRAAGGPEEETVVDDESRARPVLRREPVRPDLPREAGPGRGLRERRGGRRVGRCWGSVAGS